MISALIVVLIGTSARRGFVRGAPRELVDLLIVALGLPLAFRLGAPIGAALFSDFAPLATRTLGALVVLVVLAIAAIGLRRALDQGHNELEPAERTLGAVLGTLRAGLVAVVVLAVVAAAPTTSALSRTAPRSWIVSTVTDPDGFAMTLFEAVTGEDGMIALIAFNRTFPDGPVVVDDYRQIPAFEPADVQRLPPQGIEILDLVNAERLEAGVANLSWSSALTEVAMGYANEMYISGFFAHVSARSGDVGSRLNAAGISYAIAGENLALAPNVASVHGGLMNSPGHRANILESEFTHVGIGVVEGPIGLIVVQVFFRA